MESARLKGLSDLLSVFRDLLRLLISFICADRVSSDETSPFSCRILSSIDFLLKRAILHPLEAHYRFLLLVRRRVVRRRVDRLFLGMVFTPHNFSFNGPGLNLPD